jgi:hypothetical protein
VGLGAGAVLILILIGIVVSLTRAKPAPESPTSPAGGATPQDGQATSIITSPNFCGVPVVDHVVVYVLDRGSGTADSFSYLKEACFRSIGSLGADRRFQILFWNNGSDDGFPMAGPTLATPLNLEAARKSLESVYAHGQSDAATALTRAISTNPDRIVLATAKGGQLGDEFVQQVLKIQQGHPTKIDTFDIGTDTTAALKAIANQTGGNAYVLSEADLKKYGKD